MFEIVAARWLAPNVRRLEILAYRIAKKQQPGQFVIVRVHDHGERIPLTIADSDAAAGTITLIVQGVGKTTRLLNALEAGQFVLDIAGPLGNASPIRRYGSVVVVAGGVGAAIVWPIARALKHAGNRVLSILGARSKSQVILENEMREASDDLFIMTDDGSYGEGGLVTQQLEQLLRQTEPIHFVLAVGPIPMMRGVAEVTRPFKISTSVSLNSIMVDGTGMCGGCRVLVGGETRFACVDGPEFDAHQVDFDVLARRNAMYKTAERDALAQYEAHPELDSARIEDQCRLIQQRAELANSI
jgi:ferredoxin--NADP+ reductase